MLHNNPDSKYKPENLIVGYIIAFNDERPDKVGHFRLDNPQPNPIGIFSEILKVEPSTRESSYIFSNIRQVHPFPAYIDTVEFKEDEITSLLKKLAKPGIIKTL